MRVRGSIALDVESAFDAMWESSTSPPTLAPAESGDGQPAVAILAEDLPGKGRVASIYEWLARSAQETLEITDAYMVAPAKVLGALQDAARRGVSVRILLPGRNNHPVAGAAARWVYEGLLDAGVRIFEWEGVMIHAKTAVADGRIALVGSSNLDPLSMSLNFELNLAVVDPATGEAMHRMFERDLSEARAVLPSAWRRRPLWQKAAERAAAMVGGRL